jgi:leucyl/phenylalanyl-tRNA--protein transferase
MIVAAYHHGLFPMAEGRYGSIGFYYYEPRGVIPLDERFKVRRSLRQALKRDPFEIRFDTAFEEVIRACARYDELSDREVWLSEEMITLYTELHYRGIAHSVEAWRDGKVMGGLYGISIGRAFCGESMFSRIPNASQAALAALVGRLREKGFILLDAQMATGHLEQFGLYSVTQDEYIELFREATKNAGVEPAF